MSKYRRPSIYHQRKSFSRANSSTATTGVDTYGYYDDSDPSTAGGSVCALISGSGAILQQLPPPPPPPNLESMRVIKGFEFVTFTPTEIRPPSSEYDRLIGGKKSPHRRRLTFNRARGKKSRFDFDFDISKSSNRNRNDYVEEDDDEDDDDDDDDDFHQIEDNNEDGGDAGDDHIYRTSSASSSSSPSPFSATMVRSFDLERMPDNILPNEISDAEARAALFRFVDDKFCYGTKAASQMTIRDMIHSYVFQYSLESYCEKRQLCWTYEPFVEVCIPSSMTGPEAGTVPTTAIWNGENGVCSQSVPDNAWRIEVAELRHLRSYIERYQQQKHQQQQQQQQSNSKTKSKSKSTNRSNQRSSSMIDDYDHRNERDSAVVAAKYGERLAAKRKKCPSLRRSASFTSDDPGSTLPAITIMKSILRSSSSIGHHHQHPHPQGQSSQPQQSSQQSSQQSTIIYSQQQQRQRRQQQQQQQQDRNSINEARTSIDHEVHNNDDSNEQDNEERKRSAWDLFENRVINVAVPGTVNVHSCHNCGGVGRKRCTTCAGSGTKSCQSCTGNGYYGGYYHKSALTKSLETSDYCWRCHGRGRLRCYGCNGDGMIVCAACIGSGQIKCYIKMIVTLTNHQDSVLIRDHHSADVPIEALNLADGDLVFEEEGHNLYHIANYIDEAITRESERLIALHESRYLRRSRLILQRHRVTVIPIAKVIALWRRKQFHFHVFGSGEHHRCHTADYPQRRTCWCCCIV